jgi:phage regulator Rha-like protein
MKALSKKSQIILPIESLVHSIRGQKVMLDSDLAKLYGVETRNLNQAVRRNFERFPDDFVFQMTINEAESLRSQTVILNNKRGKHLKYAPFAFTEQGIAMLSSVLRSPRAVQMNIAIMRAFVRMRELVASNKEFAVRLDKLERSHERTGDVMEMLVEDIEKINADINWIKNPPLKPKRRIGYIVGKEDE